MLYMVQAGSKIAMDYAGNNMTRNTSMVKYVIYSMGRVNIKFALKNYELHHFLRSNLYCKTAYSKLSSKTSPDVMFNFVLFREIKQTPVNNMNFSNKFLFKILCSSGKEINPLTLNQKHCSFM